MNKAILPIFTFSILFGVYIYLMYVDWTSARCDPDEVCKDGNGCIHYLGRKNKRDEIQDHLDRIDWVAVTNLRTNKIIRAFTQGILMMFFIMVLMWRDWPSVVDILLMVGIATMVGLAISKLYDFHADIYPIYYIKDNTKAIRKKLDLEEEKEPKSPGPIRDIPHHSVIRMDIDDPGDWGEW